MNGSEDHVVYVFDDEMSLVVYWDDLGMSMICFNTVIYYDLSYDTIVIMHDVMNDVLGKFILSHSDVSIGVNNHVRFGILR